MQEGQRSGTKGNLCYRYRSCSEMDELPLCSVQMTKMIKPGEKNYAKIKKMQFINLLAFSVFPIMSYSFYFLNWDEFSNLSYLKTHYLAIMKILM